MNNNKWIPAENNQIKKGMLVKGVTMTWAQKWTLLEGYEDCNCTVYGIVISNDHLELTDIKVNKIGVVYYTDPLYDMLNECYLVRDVGSSGSNSVYVFVGSEKEKKKEIEKIKTIYSKLNFM